MRPRAAATVCALALGGLPAVALAPGDARPQRVTFRLVTGERYYHLPVRGTFTASGAVADHGAVSGLLVPIYRRQRDGGISFDAVRLALTARGSRGSFTVRAKLYTASFDVGFREKGTSVVIAASGVYRRLAPFAAVRGIDYAGPVIRATRTMQGHLLKTAGPYPGRAPQ